MYNLQTGRKLQRIGTQKHNFQGRHFCPSFNDFIWKARMQVSSEGGKTNDTSQKWNKYYVFKFLAVMFLLSDYP